MIRAATSADAAAIAAIYNHYVLHTTVTFEEEAIADSEIATRIADVQGASLPWLVWVEGSAVLGYAYAGKWKTRCSYRYSVETSLYLDHRATRRGIGSALYIDLIGRLKSAGLHAIIGGVALPNPGSQRLHEKLGFEKVAHFKAVGWKFNQWIDVGYWELLLPSVTPTATASR